MSIGKQKLRNVSSMKQENKGIIEVIKEKIGNYSVYKIYEVTTMSKKVLLLFLLAGVLSSCGNKPKKQDIIENPPIENVKITYSDDKGE